MTGYSVARRVNYCKCMENYKFFRRVKLFGRVCLDRPTSIKTYQSWVTLGSVSRLASNESDMSDGE